MTSLASSIASPPAKTAASSSIRRAQDDPQLTLTSIRLFAKVVLPASVPTIFTGIRLAAAHSILVFIAAEMVGSKALGYRVNSAEFNFQIPQMYAGIVTLALLGLLVNLALVRVESRLSGWRLQ